MERKEAEQLLKGGPEGIQNWNTYRRTNHEIPSLNGIILRNCDLKTVNLNDADLSGANLSNTNLAGAKFSGSILNKVDFNNAELSSTGFHSATINNSSFCDSKLNSANFLGAILNNVKLTNCNLVMSVWCNTTLERVNFSSSLLNGVNFNAASLLYCDLHEIVVDQAARLSDVVSIKGTKIDRFTLETLIGQGVLTQGQRMVMDIHDDVATLRLAFGGFYRWLHILSLIVFLAPYTWFVVFHNLWAQYESPDAQSLPMIVALMRYIVSGGGDWASGWHYSWIAIPLFTLALILNAVRFAMLWKTSKLEHEEKVTTLPSKWTLRSHPRWTICFKISQWSIWIFVVITAINSVYFLSKPIPLPANSTAIIRSNSP